MRRESVEYLLWGAVLLGVAAVGSARSMAEPAPVVDLDPVVASPPACELVSEMLTADSAAVMRIYVCDREGAR